MVGDSSASGRKGGHYWVSLPHESDAFATAASLYENALKQTTILAKIMWKVSFLKTASHLPGADLHFDNPSPPPLLNVVQCNLFLTFTRTSLGDIQH